MHSSYSLSKCLVCFTILAIQTLIRRVSSLNRTNAYLNHKCLVIIKGNISGRASTRKTLTILLIISHVPKNFRMVSHTHLVARLQILSPSYFNVGATPTVPSVVLAMPPPSQGFVGDVKDTREQLYESFNKKTRDFLYNLMLKADKPKSR
ncbi:unnamed protein product [Arabidopsis thaliana]|uniref:Uncharacterized protein n=1 Tax=Arabidopsis thaliana TaxID=3702 RepID=A0A654FAG8_ARATH|nr:unnamed protein product [Arabidopsis thaliana]